MSPIVSTSPTARGAHHVGGATSPTDVAPADLWAEVFAQHLRQTVGTVDRPTRPTLELPPTASARARDVTDRDASTDRTDRSAVEPRRDRPEPNDRPASLRRDGVDDDRYRRSDDAPRVRRGPIDDVPAADVTGEATDDTPTERTDVVAPPPATPQTAPTDDATGPVDTTTVAAVAAVDATDQDSTAAPVAATSTGTLPAGAVPVEGDVAAVDALAAAIDAAAAPTDATVVEPTDAAAMPPDPVEIADAVSTGAPVDPAAIDVAAEPAPIAPTLAAVRPVAVNPASQPTATNPTASTSSSGAEPAPVTSVGAVAAAAGASSADTGSDTSSGSDAGGGGTAPTASIVSPTGTVRSAEASVPAGFAATLADATNRLGADLDRLVDRSVGLRDPGELSIDLSDEGLGGLVLSATSTAGQLHLKLTAADPTVADLLRNAGADLRRDLEQGGLQLGSFDIGHGDGSPDRRPSTESGPATARPAADAGRLSALATPVRTSSSGAAGLDLRL
jgi:flagellar hook-length control protein FliK